MQEQILDNELGLTQTAEPVWAGFWIRLGAAVIDGLIFLPLMALSFYNLMSIKEFSIQIGISLVMMIYKPFFEAQYGATLGKMVVKIKVVNSSFGAINMQQAITRYWPWLISSVISLFGTYLVFQESGFASADSFLEIGALRQQTSLQFINYISSILFIALGISIAVNTKKRGIHDLTAGTYCIYK